MGRQSYTRVLLKLSGESLAGDQGYGIDPQTLNTIASEIKEVVDRACNWRLSSAAATFSAAWPPRPRGWIAPAPITWGCWPP